MFVPQQQEMKEKCEGGSSGTLTAVVVCITTDAGYLGGAVPTA